MHWTWLLNQPMRNQQPRFEDWILYHFYTRKRPRVVKQARS